MILEVCQKHGAVVLTRRLILFFFFVSTVIAPFAEAHAGILIRSSRVRSQTNYRPQRARLHRVRKSTAAPARINPIAGRSESYGTLDSMEGIEKSQVKYYKKLHRWDKKRIRAEQKHAKKIAKQKRLEERKREKERRKLARKQQKEERAKKKRERNGESEATQPEITKTSKGETAPAPAPRKESFWSRFWRSLFGRSKTERPEAKAKPSTVEKQASRVEKPAKAQKSAPAQPRPSDEKVRNLFE